MNSAALSSLSGVVAIAVPLFLVGLFAWAIFRTESRHTLRFRLWQLIQGNREISDPLIRSYLDEQNSLMAFRFIAGVPVSNLEQAQQLLKWTRLRKVEMYALRMAGNYFDSEHRVIRTEKLPTPITQVSKLALASLAIPIVAACLAMIYVDSAVLNIRATGRWMLMTGSQAKAVWPLMQNPLTRTNCAEDAKTAGRGTGFSDREVKVVCEVLADEATASHLQKTVQQQWRPALILLVETLVIAYLLCASFMSGFVARRLARRNIDPGLGDEQLDLPLQSAGQSIEPQALPNEIPGSR